MEMKNVFLTLDHNSLLYHKRFLDVFAPIAVKLGLSSEKEAEERVELVR